jgi:hypothetical protein
MSITGPISQTLSHLPNVGKQGRRSFEVVPLDISFMVFHRPCFLRTWHMFIKHDVPLYSSEKEEYTVRTLSKEALKIASLLRTLTHDISEC